MSLIWTVLCEDEVFAGFGALTTAPQLMEHGGVSMLVTPLGDGTGRIERVLSARPSDFLRTDCQPGMRVRLPMPE